MVGFASSINLSYCFKFLLVLYSSFKKVYHAFINQLIETTSIERKYTKDIRFFFATTSMIVS